MASAIEQGLKEMIAGSRAEAVSLATCSLRNGDEVLIDAERPFHPASMFKLPVMMETYRQARLGAITLDEPVQVENEFRSIVDGSAYQLLVEDDSEKELYECVGQSFPRRELVRRMIAVSSNLATNILMKDLEPGEITHFMEALGAGGLVVRRGVEDKLAYRQGLNNSATAYGFMRVLARLAQRQVVTPADSDEMISILCGQVFNEMIPARLPEDVRVAHKTGWVADYHHDAGIVYPPAGEPFVLAVLTKGYSESEDASAHELVASLAKAVYDHWNP